MASRSMPHRKKGMADRCVSPGTCPTPGSTFTASLVYFFRLYAASCQLTIIRSHPPRQQPLNQPLLHLLQLLAVRLLSMEAGHIELWLTALVEIDSAQCIAQPLDEHHLAERLALGEVRHVNVALKMPPAHALELVNER